MSTRISKNEDAFPRVIVNDVELVPSLVLGLSEADTGHLVRVLRLRRGDRIVAVGKGGRSAVARLLDVRGKRASAEVEYLIPLRPESRVLVDLAVAMPKGGRADFLVEKLTEIGVHALIPMITARSIVTPREGSEKLSRWRRIAREAARQSHRPEVMEVSAPEAFERVLGRFPEYALVLAGEPGGHVSLIETVKRELRGGVREKVRLLLLVGPEGGFTGPELERMAAHRCIFVCISDGVLRVETAAIVMAGCAFGAAEVLS